MTEPNLNTRNCTEFIVFALGRHFVELFVFYTNLSNFVDHFGFFGQFVDLFGPVSLLKRAEILLCTEHSAALMHRVQR